MPLTPGGSGLRVGPAVNITARPGTTISPSSRPTGRASTSPRSAAARPTSTGTTWPEATTTPGHQDPRERVLAHRHARREALLGDPATRPVALVLHAGRDARRAAGARFDPADRLSHLAQRRYRVRLRAGHARHAAPRRAGAWHRGRRGSGTSAAACSRCPADGRSATPSGIRPGSGSGSIDPVNGRENRWSGSPTGNEFFAWTAEGALLSASGNRLLRSTGERRTGPRWPASAEPGLQQISRLAMSPSGDRLALVGGEPAPKAP